MPSCWRNFSVEFNISSSFQLSMLPGFYFLKLCNYNPRWVTVTLEFSLMPPSFLFYPCHPATSPHCFPCSFIILYPGKALSFTVLASFSNYLNNFCESALLHKYVFLLYKLKHFSVNSFFFPLWNRRYLRLKISLG